MQLRLRQKKPITFSHSRQQQFTKRIRIPGLVKQKSKDLMLEYFRINELLQLQTDVEDKIKLNSYWQKSVCRLFLESIFFKREHDQFVSYFWESFRLCAVIAIQILAAWSKIYHNANICQPPSPLPFKKTTVETGKYAL